MFLRAGLIALPNARAQITVTATLTYRTTRGDRARVRARVNRFDESPSDGEILRPGAYPLVSHGRKLHTVTLTWGLEAFPGADDRWEFWLEAVVVDRDDDGDARFRAVQQSVVIEAWVP